MRVMGLTGSVELVGSVGLADCGGGKGEGVGMGGGMGRIYVKEVGDAGLVEVDVGVRGIFGLEQGKWEKEGG